MAAYFAPNPSLTAQPTWSPANSSTGEAPSQEVYAGERHASHKDMIADRVPIPAPAGHVAATGGMTLDTSLHPRAGVVMSHKDQALYDQLCVAAPTPRRPPVALAPQVTGEVGAYGRVNVDGQVLAGAFTAAFAGDASLLARFGAARGRAPAGDPHTKMAEAIRARAWQRTTPPPGMSEEDLFFRIAHIMQTEGAGSIEDTAEQWAVADPGDPICVDLGVAPASRNRLIALAARHALPGDRFGLSPPGSGIPLTAPDRLKYCKKRVYLVHGSMRMNMTRNPGLANFVQPRWCIRADLDALIPGLHDAEDMVGMPWATMTIHDGLHDAATWQVFNPSDNKTKTKTVSLSVDPTPEWEYDPEAIRRMLVVIGRKAHEEARGKRAK